MAGPYCTNPIACPDCTNQPTTNGECPRCKGTRVIPCGTRFAFAPPARVFCPRCSNSKSLKRAGVPRQGKGVQDPLEAYAHKPPTTMSCPACGGTATKGGQPCGRCNGSGKVPYEMPMGVPPLPPAVVDAVHDKALGASLPAIGGEPTAAATDANQSATNTPGQPPDQPPAGPKGHSHKTVKKAS